MKKELTSRNFIKCFGITAVICILVFGGMVILFDPFFHYHKPLPFLKAVLWEKEYQVPGTLDHFDYDAVIAGSSVAENYNNSWFDTRFDCKSVKAIRSYGGTADLCYFIERGFKNRDLKYVFFNLDPSSLISGTYTTFEETGSPMYLYDKNVFNDVKYIWNKDVLCERIPYMAATSFMKDYDEGTSYNWGQWKTFGKEEALSHFYRTEDVLLVKPDDYYEDIATQNTALLTGLIKAHPETLFYVYIPPYSVLWWDTINRDGDVGAYVRAEEIALKTLLEYENVKIFNFQNDTDTVFNLDLYLDSLHFSPAINEYICDSLKNDRFRLMSASEIDESLREVYSYAVDSSEYVDELLKDNNE